MMVGGLNEALEATPEIQSYCDQLKSEVEEKAGTKFDVYECKTYRHQLVAGMNYFVKVYVGNEDYIHLRIYKKLDNSLELSAVKVGLKDHHELKHFQQE